MVVNRRQGCINFESLALDQRVPEIHGDAGGDDVELLLVIRRSTYVVVPGARYFRTYVKT